MRKIDREKRLLRKEINARIRSMSYTHHMEADKSLTRRALSMPMIQQLSKESLVLGYAALPDEPKLSGFWLYMLKQDVNIAFPRIELGDTGKMTFHKVTTWSPWYYHYKYKWPPEYPREDEWQMGGWDEFWMPKKSCQQVDCREASLIIVPGRAFSPDGRRLGRGGGFYDRFLPTLHRDMPIIAFVYDEQIVEDIPFEAHDCRVDWLITPTREWRIEK